jgi:prepilin-type processing-associated H-X9-DG protein
MAAGVPVAIEERSMRRAGRSAFILTELLVVCALIVILAAILLPVFAQVREAARKTTCLSNLRQIALAHRIYVQDHDDTLPTFYVPGAGGYMMWPEFLHPYYRDPRLLDQGFMEPRQQQESGWLADYAMCAWGPGGRGTWEKPYFRWPGALARVGSYLRPMRLAEVLRHAEVLQFADGLTSGSRVAILSRHGDGRLNGAYVDGHVGRVSEAACTRIDQDERGYFYSIGAADR